MPRIPVAGSLFAALLVNVLAAAASSALDLRDPWDHAPGHAILALSAAALVFLAKRRWPTPPSDRVDRAARFVLVAGLAVLATGQALEALGAFGSERGWLRSRLSDVHGVAAYISTLGLVLTMFGALAAVMVAAAARMGLLGSRWMAAALAVPVAAASLFVIGALVYGY